MTGHKFRRPDSECISHAELKRRFEYVGNAGLRRKDSRRGKTGNVNTTGYVRVQIDGKSYLMHRLVVFYHTGKWPLEVNHKKRNKRNNAIENLEDSTRKANQTHALGKPCAAFSGRKKVAAFPSIVDAAAWAKVRYQSLAKAIKTGQVKAGYLWRAG